MNPEAIVNILLETAEEEAAKGQPKEPFDPRAYFLDASFEAKVKEAERLYAQSRSAVMRRLSTASGEQVHRIMTSIDQLDRLYAERHLKLAQIRYALAYRRALQKAGVRPEDVAHRYCYRENKAGLFKEMMREVELKDGRRVRIEPFEIPRELLKR